MVPAPVERRQLPGHRQRSPNSAAPTVGFFIPLRVVAENPARRISTCSGRLGDAAAADDVADFFLVFHRALPDLQRMKLC